VSDTKPPILKLLKPPRFGVQFLTIIISIIRTKLIAIFIGPAGMGIITLLNSTINVLSGISGLGIETSGIKHIASNYKNNDLSSVAKIATIVKKAGSIYRYFRMLTYNFLSTWLSQLTLEIQIIAFHLFLFLLRYCSSS
jgi:O-antigen/teichoic acid export membrane protein